MDSNMEEEVLIMYKHTQIGWGIIIILGLVMLFVYFNIFGKYADSFVYIILALALIMFSKLTITVDEDYVRLVFGIIGFPRRKFKLTDIKSCQSVKKMMFGISLGIHFGSRGSLYNVSGPHAVELTMKNGRRVYIGTDEPDQLREAIAVKLTK
jgi:hypothetical protein